MRLVALLIPLLFLAPTAAASRDYSHNYVMGLGNGCAGGGLLIRNCETYFPEAGETRISATADDMSGNTVRVRICHEYTYHDGSHPYVRCVSGCDTVADNLVWPKWPHNTTYRLVVDLRGGPGACQAPAQHGTLSTVFT